MTGINKRQTRSYPPPCGEGRRTQASLRSLRKLGCAAPGWGWCSNARVRLKDGPPPPTPPQPAAGLPASGKPQSDQTPASRGLVGEGSRPSASPCCASNKAEHALERAAIGSNDVPPRLLSPA